METKQPDTIPELISFSAAELLLSKSRSWIHHRIRTDPNFPKPIQIAAHSVAFKRSELIAWIDSLPRAIPDGLSAIERRKAA